MFTSAEPAAAEDAQHNRLTAIRVYAQRHPATGFAAALLLAGGGYFTYQGYESAQDMQHSIAEQNRKLAEQSAQIKENQDTIRGLSKSAAGAAGVSLDTVLGKGLRKPESLQRANAPDTALAQQKQRASMFMALRDAGEAGEWRATCNATLVAFEGVERVITSRHCLDDELKEGQAANGKGKRKGGPAAMDVSALLDKVEVGFFPKGTELSALDESGPAYVASEIAISGESDIAMMTVKPTDTEIPAMDISSRQAQPTPGDRVALAAMSASSKFMPREASGIYIGRSEFGANGTYTDIVVIKTSSSNADPCSFGASGSLAVIGDAVSGPLSRRLNVSDQRMQSDYGTRDVNQWRRWQIEDTLKVSVEGYDVMCGYAVMDQNALLDLNAVLGDADDGTPRRPE